MKKSAWTGEIERKSPDLPINPDFTLYQKKQEKGPGQRVRHLVRVQNFARGTEQGGENEVYSERRAFFEGPEKREKTYTEY